MECILELVKYTGHKNIYEIGCGEGQILGMLYRRGFSVSGVDLDDESIQTARVNFQRIKANIHLEIGNLFSLTKEIVDNRMIICCEVLEHVVNPEEALRILCNCTNEYMVISVPHEPIWCFLNFCRGKYWKSFGNTPGYINHWTRGNFIKFLSQYGTIEELRSPLPWLVALVKIDKNKI